MIPEMDDKVRLWHTLNTSTVEQLFMYLVKYSRATRLTKGRMRNENEENFNKSVVKVTQELLDMRGYPVVKQLPLLRLYLSKLPARYTNSVNQVLQYMPFRNGGRIDDSLDSLTGECFIDDSESETPLKGWQTFTPNLAALAALLLPTAAMAQFIDGPVDAVTHIAKLRLVLDFSPQHARTP